MNHWRMLERLATETDEDAVKLAGCYTLLDQSAGASMLPTCWERGVSVLAAGVFNGGMLATDDPTPDAMFNYAPASDELRARAIHIAAVCREHGVTLPQAAMAFAAAHPAVASVVLGMRTGEQSRRNAELFARPVPDALWHDLVAVGLLPGTVARDR
jgi:D-threo-aldose 1-dehydrogenase